MTQIPLPQPYQDTEEYWKAAKEHRFIIQQCGDLRARHQFYPRGVCSHCLCSDLEWNEAIRSRRRSIRAPSTTAPGTRALRRRRRSCWPSSS